MTLLGVISWDTVVRSSAISLAVSIASSDWLLAGGVSGSSLSREGSTSSPILWMFLGQIGSYAACFALESMLHRVILVDG